MNEMKNTIQSLNTRADQTEERISEIEDMNFEIIQPEEKKEWKRVKKSYIMYGTLFKKKKKTNARIFGVLEGEEREKWEHS